MLTNTPKTTYLKDYAPPAYRIPTVDLRFELGEDHTMVHSRLHVIRAKSTPAGTPLALDGQHLELIVLELNGAPLAADRYQVDANHLTLRDPPAEFELAVVTRIRPQDNAALEGLYQSSGNFCTQCEAEGFRRITYFLDRPDVMAVFILPGLLPAHRCGEQHHRHCIPGQALLPRSIRGYRSRGHTSGICGPFLPHRLQCRRKGCIPLSSV